MANRELLEKVLGTQRFRDLDLLFKNGVASDYGDHRVGYDGLGFLGFEIGRAHNENMSPSRAKYFQGWFRGDTTGNQVKDFLNQTEKGQSLEDARLDNELDISRKAEFFLESPKIRATLFGLKGDVRFSRCYGQGYDGQDAKELNYIALLAGIFRSKSPEIMDVIRKNCLETMKGDGQISFKSYTRKLFLSAFQIDDRDYLKRAEEESTQYIQKFTEELFLVICNDAKEHSEHRFRTSIIRPS
jgi:hypothetical protein